MTTTPQPVDVAPIYRITILDDHGVPVHVVHECPACYEPRRRHPTVKVERLLVPVSQVKQLCDECNPLEI